MKNQIYCRSKDEKVQLKSVTVPDMVQMLPLGVTVLSRGIFVSVSTVGENCQLVLYHQGEADPFIKIPFPSIQRMGNVWYMQLEGNCFDHLEYCFEIDEKLFSDPYGRSFGDSLEWGDVRRASMSLRSVIGQERFDWQEDQGFLVPYEKSIVYRTHVRGFTKHSTAQVEKRGCFGGIIEKIPYLKELGITTLELMPVIEFNESMEAAHPWSSHYTPVSSPERMNYWGYTSGYYFAPKKAFSSEPGKNPQFEFKNMVKALHQAGIELIIELYFSGQETPSFILEVVRFWVREYHVDGIHFVGEIPTALLANDPYLKTTKLWYTSWGGSLRAGESHTLLAEYRNDFQNCMRRFLKGDEDQLNGVVYHTKYHNQNGGVIKYLSNSSGFTLMDLVSYDRKHNEANGEKNRDGEDYNYSWNCGVEGSSRKKKVIDLRRKQIRNAMVLLMLSQGTPLLLAGDEFGNTQQGNNNAYCQDNEISWLNWKQRTVNQDIFEFTKALITFRKMHPIFSLSSELRVLDYKACGYPDVSYHGVDAWCPEFENFRRELGVLYCGLYAQSEEQKADHYFYVIYNMHWEKHEFALPHIPRTLRWYLAINTDDKVANGIYPDGTELILKDQKKQLVPPRSIFVLIGK